MSHHPRHTALHRRALAIGGLLSIAVHAALLALVRVDIRPFAPDETAAIFEPAPPPPAPIEPTVVLNLLESAPAAPAQASPAPAGSQASPAAAAPATAPAASRTAAPAALADSPPSAAEPSYEPLVVLDPMRSATADPIAFDDLPVAETTPAARPADDVPVYQPGSIGSAKRGWAASARGETEIPGDRGWTVIVGPGGDGHCPMPSGGRGRAPRTPPPLWGR